MANPILKLGLPKGSLEDPTIDLFDREKVFIDTVLAPLTQRFPKLKVVMEHITTQDAAELARRVRIALTDTGRALRAEAEKIPACVLQRTQCTLPELQALTGQLSTLRARLAPRRSHSG